MTIFRAKIVFAISLLFLPLTATYAHAQNTARQASFLPPAPGDAPPPRQIPVPTSPPEEPSSTDPSTAPPIIIAPTYLPLATTTPPSQTNSKATPPASPPPAVTAAPVVPAEIKPAPISTTAASPAAVAPVGTSTITINTNTPINTAAPLAPITTPPITTPIVITAPAPAPITSVTPVTSDKLSDINPESIGFLSSNEGGLGTGLWKGTPLALAEKLVSSLDLPARSPALNKLAHRLLLTTAAVPEGTSDGKQGLTAMRVEKLVMLGDAANAWHLAILAKPEQIDDITLRLTAESALATDAGADVCAKLPDIMKQHTNAEWQKLLLVCQLRANDTKAAQLTLDVLHTQNVKDDIFFELAERNIIGGKKQLPRQLTPLKPLMMALLQMIDLPIRDEVYGRPPAALIPALLKLKAVNETARLGLAERTASRGLLDAEDLATVYQSQVFDPDRLALPTSSAETGPKLRALLYQGALLAKQPDVRVNCVLQFYHSLDASDLNGSVAKVLAGMLKDVEPATNFNVSSATLARIMLMGGKTDAAMAWLKAANSAGVGIPAVGAELQDLWPLTVLAGYESDKDFASDLNGWFEGRMKPKDQDQDSDNRTQRDQTAATLLLLEADGFTVPDDIWARAVSVPVYEKRAMPPAVILERLRMAGAGNRRGEAVLESILATGGLGEPALTSTLEAVRALRLVGLTSDAANLAREAAVNLGTAKP